MITVGTVEQNVIPWLNNIQMTSDKMRRFSRLAGEEMVHSTKQNFLNQQDPEGRPWLPSIRAIAESGETLRDKGRLFNSLTYVESTSGAEWGTNVVYGPWVHNGATIKPRTKPYLAFMTAIGFFRVKEVNLPSRKFLGVSNDDQITLAEVLQQVINEP